MGQVKLLAQLSAVERFVVNSMETRINVVEQGSRVLASLQDGTALDIVQDDIELVRLIGEPAVVEENIWPFPSLNLSGDANGFAGRRVGIEYGWWPRIWRLQLTHPKDRQIYTDPRQIMNGLLMITAFQLNSSMSH